METEAVGHPIPSSEFEDDIVNEERTCEVINSTDKAVEPKEKSGEKPTDDVAIKDLEASHIQVNNESPE